MTLLVYDKTCTRWWGLLRWTWVLGTWLYVFFGRAQARYGAESWDDALDWLISQAKPQLPIHEIQFWGHGSPGRAVIGTTFLGVGTSFALRSPRLAHLGSMMAANGHFWFRTCSTFAGDNGQRLARMMAMALQRRVAGHTFIIWKWHSGLRVVQAPNEQKPIPNIPWDPSEGILRGTPALPLQMAYGKLTSPRTISCWRTRIPQRWLEGGG
jgi:hypothetical protein